MNQLAIDIAPILRDVGMAQTLKAEGDEWIDKALRELRTFCAQPGWALFKTEDFRAWLASRMPPPHSPAVWGAFTNRACKAGIIRWTGRYVTSVSPKTHAHPVKQWEPA